MTKIQYLEELKKFLKTKGVTETEDIISEYSEHFDIKLEQGISESDIAEQLGDPHAIANEYAEYVGSEHSNKRVTVPILKYVSFIPLSLLYILMWGVVIVLAAFSLSLLILCICLIFKVKLTGIGYIPYISAFLCGMSCCFLSVLSATAFICFGIHLIRVAKKYILFLKENIINNYNEQPTNKIKRNLKITIIICVTGFILSLLLSYLSMCLIASSFEPWHILNWFMQV